MTNASTRFILLIALVAAVAGGVATYGVSALTETGNTEVRISAQRLEGGIIEFALQQRGEDGSWGERILPSARKLRAEGRLNSWANSTPIQLESGLPFYVNTTQPTTSVNVDEYIALCGDEESLFGEVSFDIQDGFDTWGSLFSLLDPVIGTLRSIEPPPELADYHQGQLSTLTILAQYAFVQDPEAEVDLWEFLIVALIAAGPSEEAEANLDPELRQRLIDAGCIEADDSEAAE